MTTASATQLQVVVPQGVASAVDVRVINTANQQQGSSLLDGAGAFRITFAGGALGANTYRRVQFSSGFFQGGLDLADMNQDGRLDIVGVNVGNIVLVSGDGAGGFAAPVAIPVGFFPLFPQVADMTGDGLLDVIVQNQVSQEVSLLRGLGAAGFASAQTICSGPGLTDAKLVEDFDGDGLLDLIVQDGTYQLLRNTGNGTFAAVPLTLPLAAGMQGANLSGTADFNRDGRADLYGYAYVGSGFSGCVWHRNAANTGYDAPETTAPIPGSLSGGYNLFFQAGDLNQDGRPDLVAAYDGSRNQFSVNVWLHNAGAGFATGLVYTTATVTSYRLRSLLLADATGDGSLDLAVTDQSRLYILPNSGSGTGFAPASSYVNNYGFDRVSSGDLNNDGRLDFVTPNLYAGGNPEATLLLNTGSTGGTSGTNNAPTLNALADITIDEDSGPYTVPLTGISTGGDAGQAVTVTAVSSHPSILPNPTVSYISPTATGSLRLQALPDAFGTVTVTVTASDGQAQNGTVTRSFRVIVNPVNDQPTLDPIPDIVVTNPSTPIVVRLSGITSGAANENQVLRVNNSTTFANTMTSTSVVYISPGTWGELRTYVSASGPGLFSTNTVTVDDGQNANNSISRTFRIYYQPTATGTSPTLDPLSDVVANRTLTTQLPVALTGIGDGDPNQVLPLTVTATSSDPGLVSISAVGYASPATTGSVQYAISPTRGGTATITVTVDNGTGPNGTIVRSFRVTVPVVNAATATAAATTLQLYPNPSPGGQFTLETTPLNAPATLTVLDVLGREVWRQPLSTVPARLVVQPSGLRAGGVYLVRLSTSKGTASRRLVVE